MLRFLIFLSFQLCAYGTFAQLYLAKSDSLLNYLPEYLEIGIPDTIGYKLDYDCLLPIEYPPTTKNCVGLTLLDQKKECLSSEIKKLVKKEVRIPRQLRDSLFATTTFISFVVEENAEVSKVEVARSSSYHLPESMKSLAYLLDNEAIQAISKLKFVEPPLLESKPTRTMFTVPVRYSNPGK